MAHSTIIGGSTAGRLLACPGSWSAIRALPPSAEIPSEYALEGTAMHEVMAEVMRDWRGDIMPTPDFYIGRTFGDRVLRQADWDNLIVPALDALDALEREHGADFEVLAVEHSIKFPRVPGAFGTVDLILASDTHALFVDWKFGGGVGVHAIYPDPRGDLVNPQLLFYVAGAVRRRISGVSLRRLKWVGAIIQPRLDPALSWTEITPTDITRFVEDVQDAVTTALGRDPPRLRGEHCRFAPCKIACPLWTGPLLDLSVLGHVTRSTSDSAAREVTPYGMYLARAKALLDSVALMKKEVDEQLHAFLENGGLVPGWRLKAKAKQRQWVDEDIVNNELTELGFGQDEIWQRKLVTFAAAEATAKRLGVEIPDDLRVAPSTDETTIAATDDPAPVVERQPLIEQFSAALQQLKMKQLS